MWKDDLVDEVHATRQRLLQSVGGDLHALKIRGDALAKSLGIKVIKAAPAPAVSKPPQKPTPKRTLQRLAKAA